MNKARTIGPVLMIMLGLALVASPAQSAVDVGVLQPDPCQILTVTAATDLAPGVALCRMVDDGLGLSPAEQAASRTRPHQPANRSEGEARMDERCWLGRRKFATKNVSAPAFLTRPNCERVEIEPGPIPSRRARRRAMLPPNSVG